MSNQKKKITDLSGIHKPKLTEKDYAFFSTFAKAVGVFKHHDLKDANCEGCYVSPSKEKNGKRVIKFIFAIGPYRTMEIPIDIDQLASNPKEYIDALLHHVNEMHKEAKRQFDTQIHILSGNALSNAVREINQASL